MQLHKQQWPFTAQLQVVKPPRASNASATLISTEGEKAFLTINSHLREAVSKAVERSCVSSQTGLYVFGCLAK